MTKSPAYDRNNWNVSNSFIKQIEWSPDIQIYLTSVVLELYQALLKIEILETIEWNM